VPKRTDIAPPGTFKHPEQQTWEFWRPLEQMMERLLPKDLFGASPPKQLTERTQTRNLFDSDEAVDNNGMLESFMVTCKETDFLQMLYFLIAQLNVICFKMMRFCLCLI
jgi:hypothetical protein